MHHLSCVAQHVICGEELYFSMTLDCWYEGIALMNTLPQEPF